MGRQDDVGEPAQGRLERRAIRAGLFREHVDRRAPELPRGQGLPQRFEIDHETAAQVDQDRPVLHGGQLSRADEVSVLGTPVDVHGHDVHSSQELLQRAADPGVAERQLLSGVVEPHLHARGLGQDGQLGTDVAVADDPETLPSDLARPLGPLLPNPPMQLLALFEEVS